MKYPERIEYLIKKLLLREPFWGNILIQAEIRENNTIPFPAAMRMENDQLFIDINSDILFNIMPNDEVRLDILKHEIMHAVLLHPLRLENLDPNIRNLAADMEVNSYCPNLQKPIKAQNGEEIRFIVAEDFKLPPQKTAEWYYKNMPKQKQKQQTIVFIISDDNMGGKGDNQQNQKGDGKGQSQKKKKDKGKGKEKGKGKGNKEFTKKELEKLKKQHKGWETFKPFHKRILKRIIDRATKMAGKAPGNIEELIQNIYEPKLNWRWLLQKAMLNGTIKASRERTTWSKPNRRFENMKGRKRLRMPDIVVAVDESGSMSKRDIERCFAEINKIASIARSVTLITFDTEIYLIGKNIRRLPKTIKIKGRGGTDFKKVFDWIEKNVKVKKPLVIMLTDGYDDEGEERNTMELVWIILEGRDTKKKWGKVIVLPEDPLDPDKE